MDEDSPAVCARPVTRGPDKGKAATGTRAGYDRHRYRSEKPCEPCRVAHCEDVKAARLKDPAAYSERRKRRYREDPEPARQRARDWGAANKARTDERVRRWRAANPDKVALIRKRWEQANPETARAIRRRIDGARRSTASIPFTAEELDARMAFFGYRCWMCGGAFDHVDHVKPLSKGGLHCLSNLRPSCQPCNSHKSATWPYPTSVPLLKEKRHAQDRTRSSVERQQGRVDR